MNLCMFLSIWKSWFMKKNESMNPCIFLSNMEIMIYEQNIVYESLYISIKYGNHDLWTKMRVWMPVYFYQYGNHDLCKQNMRKISRWMPYHRTLDSNMHCAVEWAVLTHVCATAPLYLYRSHPSSKRLLVHVPLDQVKRLRYSLVNVFTHMWQNRSFARISNGCVLSSTTA